MRPSVSSHFPFLSGTGLKLVYSLFSSPLSYVVICLPAYSLTVGLRLNDGFTCPTRHDDEDGARRTAATAFRLDSRTVLTICWFIRLITANPTWPRQFRPAASMGLALLMSRAISAPRGRERRRPRVGLESGRCSRFKRAFGLGRGAYLARTRRSRSASSPAPPAAAASSSELLSENGSGGGGGWGRGWMAQHAVVAKRARHCLPGHRRRNLHRLVACGARENNHGWARRAWSDPK